MRNRVLQAAIAVLDRADLGDDDQKNPPEKPTNGASVPVPPSTGRPAPVPPSSDTVPKAVPSPPSGKVPDVAPSPPSSGSSNPPPQPETELLSISIGDSKAFVEAFSVAVVSEIQDQNSKILKVVEEIREAELHEGVINVLATPESKHFRTVFLEVSAKSADIPRSVAVSDAEKHAVDMAIFKAELGRSKGQIRLLGDHGRHQGFAGLGRRELRRSLAS